MPIVKLKSCVAEGDLAESILDIQQNLGDIYQELSTAIAGLSPNQSDLDSGNLILTQETTQAPNPLGDFTADAGLPPIDLDSLADEERLELVGIILINGVLYLAGTGQNISNFRRLYFALGADINKFLEIVNSPDPFVAVQTYIRIQKLPTQNVAWTVQAAQALLQNPAIEAVYKAADSEYYCLVPQFLAVNKPAQQVAEENNIPSTHVVTQVFWLRTTETSSATINRLNDLGIVGDQRASVLANERLIEVRPSLFTTTEANLSIYTQKALSLTQLLNTRWGQVPAQSKEVFRQDINAAALQANAYAYDLENVVRFWPALIEDPLEIQKFLERNSPADLEYLFSKRRTVQSIDFAATDAQVLLAVRQTLSIQAGSSTLSAIQSNRAVPNLDAQIDRANLRLIQNTCGVTASSRIPIQYPDLQRAWGCLNQSIQAVPVETTRTIPLSGYESYDSPASGLFRNANVFISLGLDDKLRALENLVSEAAQPIRVVVQALAALFREAKKVVDRLFAQIRQKMNQFTAQVESFMSRYMALQGTVNVDASILRCAFGYALNADLPILATLKNFIEDFERKVRNELSKFAQIISNTLNKLLCYPVNLANGFLGGLESNLPNFCQAYKAKLPADIEAAMVEIRDTFQFQSDIVRSYQRDLFRVQASLQGAPSRLDQFKESLVCESNANSRFFQNAKSELGTGFSIPNPISALPKIGF